MKMCFLSLKLGLAALALALASVAQAASIGINFDGQGSDVTSPAGVVVQSNWNNEYSNSGGPNPLIDSTGAATTASVSYSGSGTWFGTGSGGTAGNDQLMSGYLDSGGGPNDPTVTVNGLNASHTYDVYVYLATDANYQGRDAYFTVNGATQYINNYGYSGTLVQGDNGNYLLFSGVSGPTIDVVGNQSPNGPTFRAPIAGIQIVDASSAVPEPASLALLAIGGGALGFFRRRLGLA